MHVCPRKNYGFAGKNAVHFENLCAGKQMCVARGKICTRRLLKRSESLKYVGIGESSGQIQQVVAVSCAHEIMVLLGKMWCIGWNLCVGKQMCVARGKKNARAGY